MATVNMKLVIRAGTKVQRFGSNLRSVNYPLNLCNHSYQNDYL